MNTRMFKGDGSDDDDDDVEQFLRRGTMAILTDTSSSEEDDSMPSKPKPLSKRAQMDMHREAQRLRRSNQVMIKPRSTRKSLDALARTIGMQDDVEMPPASPLNDEYAEDMEDDQENDENDDNQPRRHVRFHLSDGMSSNDQSDDELEIVGKPRRRGDRLVRSWEAHKMQLASPDRPGGASPPSPWRAPFHAIQHGGSRRENRLRALNQRLLAKISQDQQQYRKNIEAKAKAMGIYMTPEERAKSHVEREQEAAVIDLEIQQLMNKRKQQQWAPKNTNDPDDDAATADGLILSGEDEDYEDDDDDDSMDQDNASVATSTITTVTNKSAPGNDNDDDDENDTNLFMSQRSKAARAKKARSRHKLLDDDYDASAAKKSIAQAAPEPVNSIARFFGGNKTNADADDEEEDVGGSVTLTRLMQRSSLTDDDNDNDNDKDAADDDKQVDNDAEDDDEAMSEQEAAAADAAAHAALDSPLTSRTINAFDLLQSSPAKPRPPMPRSKYLEHEAEESEDEFFGIAGADEVETEDFDRFEQDGMLVHENNENVDTQALMAQHNQKMLESDQHMVEKLIKDITSGGLRRKRGAQAAGLMLEDYDLYDDEGDDLVALRLAAATKRKKHLSSDDPLTQLASDPKTAAFAKAALDIPGALELSGDEMDDDDTNAAPATDTDTQPGTSTSNHATTQAEAELEDERLAHLQELAAFSRRHFFNKVKARKLGGVSS
ncbi:MRC1-like domain-containing protein [Gongronella butleri]|nr:MRC1-like domain-containing protein [Gongronella butleri]